MQLHETLFRSITVSILHNNHILWRLQVIGRVCLSQAAQLEPRHCQDHGQHP